MDATVDAGVPEHVLSEEEGRASFDRAAWYWLNMSGDEFLRCWDAGKWDDPDDYPEVMAVAMLLPLVR